MSRKVIIKISQQILLITPILFIFFASGCSKKLLPLDFAEPDSESISEESVIEAETSPNFDLRLRPTPDFGTAEQGMPGNGSTGSFIAEPLGEGVDEEKTPDQAEPSLSEEGGNVVASLPRDEESGQLPYRSSDRLKDIHFAVDKYDLSEESRAILAENAAYLKSHPKTKIKIQGHCDARGSNDYNINLAEQRVRSTKSHLILLGVEESRIHTIIVGEEKPFCFESNEECWQQNRRAHFLIAE